MASISEISDTEAWGAASVLAKRGTRSFLSEFMDFNGIDDLWGRKLFVHSFVNNGIENLEASHNGSHAALVNWAEKLTRKTALPSQKHVRAQEAEQINKGRRWLVKKGLAATTLVTMTTVNAVHGHTAESLLDWSGLAAGGTAVLHAEKKAAQCEALFREKLPLWLKEHHNLEFIFPAGHKAGQARG